MVRVLSVVVSGSTRESVVKSLEALGILNLFETLVCAGDYARSKPAPDPFLLAAERLGVEPKDCLVFEELDIGIQAATAAGGRSVRSCSRQSGLRWGDGGCEIGHFWLLF